MKLPSLRRARLIFWLRCMRALEKRGLEESPLYYWVTRRAMANNPWKRNWTKEIA